MRVQGPVEHSKSWVPVGDHTFDRLYRRIPLAVLPRSLLRTSTNPLKNGARDITPPVPRTAVSLTWHRKTHQIG